MHMSKRRTACVVLLGASVVCATAAREVPRSNEKASLILETKTTTNEPQSLLAASVAAYDGEQWDCVLLHGAGEEVNGPVTSTFPEYWGDVEKSLPQCRSIAFNHADTKNNPWDDPVLLQSYCDAAVDGNGPHSGETVIKNKLLFTHSMSNLILAEAIKRGVCSIDKATTAWYMANGPMKGSKAADTITKICSDPGMLEAPVRWIVNEAGYCEGYNVSASYWSLRPDYGDFQSLFDIAKEQADGGMCGISPYGISSKYSAAFETISHVVAYGEDNDGMVPISSCQFFDTSECTTSDCSDPTANFYIANINHADGTGRDGDGRKLKAPCTWYSTKQGKAAGAVGRVGDTSTLVLPGEERKETAETAESFSQSL